MRKENRRTKQEQRANLFVLCLARRWSRLRSRIKGEPPCRVYLCQSSLNTVFCSSIKKRKEKVYAEHNPHGLSPFSFLPI
jgi:hypothetical protein